MLACGGVSPAEEAAEKSEPTELSEATLHQDRPKLYQKRVFETAPFSRYKRIAKEKGKRFSLRLRHLYKDFNIQFMYHASYLRTGIAFTLTV